MYKINEWSEKSTTILPALLLLSGLFFSCGIRAMDEESVRYKKEEALEQHIINVNNAFDTYHKIYKRYNFFALRHQGASILTRYGYKLGYSIYKKRVEKARVKRNGTLINFGDFSAKNTELIKKRKPTIRYACCGSVNKENDSNGLSSLFLPDCDLIGDNSFIIKNFFEKCMLKNSETDCLETFKTICPHSRSEGFEKWYSTLFDKKDKM